MGVYKDLNDYELMYLVEENDEVARDVLFEKYYPIIFGLASKYCEQANRIGLEIEDLIQEGYLGLSNAIRHYNPNGDALFYTYAVLSIKSKMFNALRYGNTQKSYCLNNYISLYKQVNSNQEGLLLEFIPDTKAVYPEEVLIADEVMLCVRDFIYSLDISNAAIMELKLNGFSHGDISKLLDISLKSVSNTICRSSRKLRNILAKNKLYNYN